MTDSGPTPRPNILIFGVDSLRADHLSSYGYPRLTSPHVDRLAGQGTLFENTFSAHIPTTSGYTSMLSGMDVFTSQVVALRHRGPVRPQVTMLPELLRGEGYNTTCVGLTGNPSSRGFDTYLDYRAWGSWEERPVNKAQDLNRAVIPELDRLLDDRTAPSSCCCATWTPTRLTCPRNPSSACSTTATSATQATTPWSPS